MSRKKLFTEEREKKVCKQYVVDKSSTVKLAKIWGCNRSTIVQIIIRNGYVLRSGKEAKEICTKKQELQICKQYVEDKLSTLELAKIWNCTAQTIRNIIIRNGYKLRTISDARKGKFCGNKNSFYGRHHSLETRQKLRNKTLLQIQNNPGPFKDTKPELKMKEILDSLNIFYEPQFCLNNCSFDFHILNTNTLIEVDGDYFHGNPKKYSKLNEMQLKMKKRDREHNKVAKDNNYILLRFWEDDILNNTNFVMNKLKEIL